MTLAFHRLVALAACAAGVALAMAPTPAGLPAGLLPTAGIVVLCVGLWATAVLPEYLTAVLFCFLAVTVAGAAPEVVFAGFYSTAGWLVFGGLIIASAVQGTGLGARIATAAAAYFGRSYRGFLWRIVLTAALMGFLVPSNMSRVLVMLPIFLSIGERLGFGPGSNGRTGITLAVAAGSIYPSFGILTAAVPNVVLLGAAESIHGIEITYGEYFLAHFPVISVVNLLALPWLIAALFPAEVLPAPARTGGEPWTATERNLLLILVAALALWVTDHWHRVSPAWVALGAGILCLMPRVGCMPATSLTGKVNLGPWLFICGIIGMGSVVVHSGLGDLLADWLFTRLPMEPGRDFLNLAAMSAVGHDHQHGHHGPGGTRHCRHPGQGHQRRHGLAGGHRAAGADRQLVHGALPLRTAAYGGRGAHGRDAGGTSHPAAAGPDAAGVAGDVAAGFRLAAATWGTLPADRD